MIKYEGGGINTSPLRLKNPRKVLAKPKPRPTVTPKPPQRQKPPAEPKAATRLITNHASRRTTRKPVPVPMPSLSAKPRQKKPVPMPSLTPRKGPKPAPMPSRSPKKH